MNDEICHRGDIYYADLDPRVGSEQGGIRPVVILQNNLGNYYAPTLIIAPITSNVRKKPKQPTHVLIENLSRCGLGRRSQVLLEQLSTIDKCRLRGYVGKMSDRQMESIAEALRCSLGLN